MESPLTVRSRIAPEIIRAMRGLLTAYFSAALQECDMTYANRSLRSTW